MNATEIDNKAKLLLSCLRNAMRGEFGDQLSNHDLDRLVLARAVIAVSAAQAERYQEGQTFDATAGISYALAQMMRGSGFTADDARNRVQRRFDEAWAGSADAGLVQ